MCQTQSFYILELGNTICSSLVSIQQMKPANWMEIKLDSSDQNWRKQMPSHYRWLKKTVNTLLVCWFKFISIFVKVHEVHCLSWVLFTTSSCCELTASLLFLEVNVVLGRRLPEGSVNSLHEQLIYTFAGRNLTPAVGNSVPSNREKTGPMTFLLL